MASENGSSSTSIDTRPGILLIGAPNVGKRTLLSRLLSVDISDASDLARGVLCQGWTIENKYYTADVAIWTSHLDEGFSIQSLPITKQLDALVMVFDMSEESSLTTLQDWIAKTDITKFEILLCIGNKADLVTGHSAHAQYRRQMLKHGESSCDPHPEYMDYGIDETEGSSLLGHEEPYLETRKLCLDWCIEHNIEYIEACASNTNFDKCLSVDGDMQGVDRLYGALSAHMWPGMILKSGNKVTRPSLVEKEESTDESDYEIEYEALSHGSDDEWGSYDDAVMARGYETGNQNNHITEKSDTNDGAEEIVASSSSIPGSSTPSDVPKKPPELGNQNNHITEKSDTNDGAEEIVASSSSIPGSSTPSDVPKKPSELGNGPETVSDFVDGAMSTEKITSSKTEEQGELESDVFRNSELDEDGHYSLDDLERLMYEIGNMRDNLRLMPDFQRREMAATLAMKMAAMFGDDSDNEVGL